MKLFDRTKSVNDSVTVFVYEKSQNHRRPQVTSLQLYPIFLLQFTNASLSVIQDVSIKS